MPVDAPPLLELSLHRHEDVYSHGMDSLWRCDEVRAQLGDRIAGFVRVSYIPRDRFDPLSGDIYNYALRRNKLGAYRSDSKPKPHLDNLDPAELAQLAYDVQSKIEGWSAANAARWPSQPVEQARQALDRWRPRVEKFLGPERDAFERFHVDKPLVDYAHVSEDLRRRGIARRLYREAAIWMAERGLALHASGIQTPEAQGLWQDLARQGGVSQVPGLEKDKPRRTLAPR